MELNTPLDGVSRREEEGRGSGTTTESDVANEDAKEREGQKASVNVVRGTRESEAVDERRRAGA